jgi:hypothetical protein
MGGSTARRSDWATCCTSSLLRSKSDYNMSAIRGDDLPCTQRYVGTHPASLRLGLGEAVTGLMLTKSASAQRDLLT